MQEKLNQLQAKFEADITLVEKLFSLETPESVQSFLKEQGLEFTLEEIAELRDALAKAVEQGESGELSDESLDGVAGGFILRPGGLPGPIIMPRPFPGPEPVIDPVVNPRRW